MLRRNALVLVVTLVSACAMPTTVVRTIDTRPGITLSGAPAGAALVVDGKRAGLASAYRADGGDGPVVLRLEPGTHELEVVDGAGQVVFKQRIFIESEVKTIVVH